MTEFYLDREEYIREANEALASMRGKEGRWWRYSASHRTFDLVVGDPTGDDNLALCLVGCDSICGPTRWPAQKLQILCDGAAPSTVVLSDQSVGFKAVARMCQWRRNFDLLRHGSLHLGHEGL